MIIIISPGLVFILNLTTVNIYSVYSQCCVFSRIVNCPLNFIAFSDPWHLPFAKFDPSVVIQGSRSIRVPSLVSLCLDHWPQLLPWHLPNSRSSIWVPSLIIVSDEYLTLDPNDLDLDLCRIRPSCDTPGVKLKFGEDRNNFW